MNTGSNSGQNAATILGRLERLPITLWQGKMRLIVGTATFFDAFDALMIAYIMPVLIPLWHINPAAIGPLLAISYFGQLLGALVAGRISEKIGRKRTLMSCIILMGVMSIVCAFAWSYTSLLIFRFIQGFGLGGEVPIAATYINEWSKAKGRGPFVVLYESVFNLGLVGAALIGSIMIPALGWQSMFILGAVPAVIVPILLGRKYPESPRWLIGQGRLEEASAAVGMVEKVITEKYNKVVPPAEILPDASAVETKTSLGELFEGVYRKRTIAVWILWFTFYFINYGIMTWLPTLYTSQFHLPLQESLLRSMSVNAVSFVAMVLVGLVIDKTGRKPLFIISLSGLAVICFLLFMTGVKTADSLFVYTLISGIFLTMAGVLYLYTPELYPTRIRGLGTSFATAWLRIASMIGPTVVGYVVMKYSLAAMFGVFCVLGVIGAITAALFAIETKNKTLEEISK